MNTLTNIPQKNNIQTKKKKATSLLVQAKDSKVWLTVIE